VVRFVLAAVAHAEQSSGGSHGIDHLLAALDRDLHRLFAEHMLAGLGRNQCVIKMQRIWRQYVHDVDIGIVGHAVHGVVAIDALVRDAVLRLPAGGLCGVAGNDARQAAVLRFLQRRRNLAGGEAAESAERKSKFFLRGGCQRPRAAGADERRGRQRAGLRNESASRAHVARDRIARGHGRGPLGACLGSVRQCLGGTGGQNERGGGVDYIFVFVP